jgi:hypothetical protein
MADFDAFESNFPPVEEITNAPNQLSDVAPVDVHAAELAAREREVFGDDANFLSEVDSAHAPSQLAPSQPLAPKVNLSTNSKHFPRWTLLTKFQSASPTESQDLGDTDAIR